MHQINIQQKAKAKPGYTEVFWHENEFTGLAKTLFHRITIPLTAFDSGLEYENQPVETEISIDWIILNLDNPHDLDGLTITKEGYPQMEATIYLGGAHNWCDVRKLNIKKIGENSYAIDAALMIDLEHEGVAQNEDFHFQTVVTISDLTNT
jgi:hypothetical protein